MRPRLPWILLLIALPVWVGALVERFGFSPQQAGSLATLFLLLALLGYLHGRDAQMRSLPAKRYWYFTGIAWALALASKAHQQARVVIVERRGAIEAAPGGDRFANLQQDAGDGAQRTRVVGSSVGGRQCMARAVADAVFAPRDLCRDQMRVCAAGIAARKHRRQHVARGRQLSADQARLCLPPQGIRVEAWGLRRHSVTTARCRRSHRSAP